MKPFDERLEIWVRKACWPVIILGSLVLAVTSLCVWATRDETLSNLSWLRELPILEFVFSAFLIWVGMFFILTLSVVVCMELRNRRRRKERR